MDFITPVVNDPFVFGQVAAANALSDIYAMGGNPLTALNLCCFPKPGTDGFNKTEFKAILEGGISKVQEAGACVVGGHTIRDSEIKYGLAVTGTIHPKDMKPNHEAKAGDVIVLTKPIGTGVLATAMKQGKISEEKFEEATHSMATLNKEACQLMVELGAHAATDITGFGLIVHLLEVAKASSIAIELQSSSVPFFSEVKRLSKQGIKTGATLANEQAAFGKITFSENIPREDQLLYFDPQTSGGLAVFLPESKAKEYIGRLSDQGISASQIGITVSGPSEITIT